MSWYKTLTIFSLPSSFNFDFDKFEAGVKANPIRECSSSLEYTSGFAPLIAGSELWTRKVDNCVSLKTAKEIRVVDSTVVQQKIAQQVQAIELEQGRKVGRKEKADIKEEIIFTLRASAHTKQTYLDCYIDLKAKIVVINGSNASMIELLYKLLANANGGSFPITPLAPQSSPTGVLTEWILKNSLPASLETGSYIKISDKSEERASVEFKKMEPLSHDVTRHLEQGMSVEKLDLRFSEKLQLTLSDNLVISKLKFDDVLREQAFNESQGGLASDMDATFSIMTLQIRTLFNRMIEWFEIDRNN